MYCVYVLELERPSIYNQAQYGGANYYVGYSSNLLHRLNQHKSGNGSVVTKRCGVKSVCGIYSCIDELHAKELEKHLAYMCNRKKPF